MIVEHGERMQPTLPHRYVAFEIHLPEIVRRWMFEADERFGAAAALADRLAMSAQDLRDRGWRGGFFAHGFEPSWVLAPAPTRVGGLVPDPRPSDLRGRGP